MHDPMTMICSFPTYPQQEWMRGKAWIPLFISNFELFTLWHVDPNIRGNDDSCGWFKRARHGDKAVLEKIVKAFEYDWDRVFKPSRQDHDEEDGPLKERVYYCGYFYPIGGGNGAPHLSVHAIVLNLFLVAANEHFKVDGRTNWKKSRRWMQKNLFDILLFAENPFDSLHDSITRKFQIGCDEPYTKRERDERIRNIASTIYGWILRADQPWYRHPRWHINHWRFQFRWWQLIHRWLFVRCSKCGKRFKYQESVIGSWSGNQVWHGQCYDSKIPLK